MSDLTWTNDTRKLSDLVPWENNPKRMTKKQADGLKASLQEFGYAIPVLISPVGNELYDGHQRKPLMEAMQEYGPDAVIDVRVSSRPLTDDERRELVVRLKQNQAGWDFDMLPNLYEREELIEWGFEPEELGMFPEDEKPDDPGAQIDRAEELREKWQTATGQLWALGEHRLVCGDCTDGAVVARVMGGERADCCVTDPPYGVDKAEWDAVFPSNDVWILHKSFLRDGANLAVFPGEAKLPYKVKILFECFDYQWPFIWYKPNAMQFGKTGYTVQSIAWWLSVGEPSHRPKCRDVIVDAIVPKNNDFGHPSPKNIKVIEELVDQLSPVGSVLYEPYLGSGTTLIACERLGRRCRAVEISPGYVAVALERWSVMTGIDPVLLDNNSDFTVISNG